MNSELIDALQLVPQPFRENTTMLMMMELFNALMDKEKNSTLSTLNEIQYAYYDATYKLKDYSKISFGAKRQLMSEMGFDYIADFINISDRQLTELLIFLNLIYALKGKKEGLELILNTLNLVYEYTVWDETTPKGVPLTATLVVTGGGFEDYNMLKNLKKFLRSYMLPWIDVVIQLIIEAPPLYVMPSYGCLMRLWDKNTHMIAREVDQRVAIYDIDDGHGYDSGLYGRDTKWQTTGYIPAPPEPTVDPETDIKYCNFEVIVESPNNAIVEINGQNTHKVTVPQYSSVTWRAYSADGTYVEQSGYIPTLSANTTRTITLQKYVEPTSTLTLSVSPSDATIKFNGVISTSNKLTVKTGTTVNWSVSKENYETQSGSVTLNRDELIPVNLVRNTYTVTLNVTTSGVTCNFDYQVTSGSPLVYKSGNVFKAKPNTVVAYTVTPNSSDYRTYTNGITVTGDQTINIALVKKEKKSTSTQVASGSKAKTGLDRVEGFLSGSVSTGCVYNTKGDTTTTTNTSHQVAIGACDVKISGSCRFSSSPFGHMTQIRLTWLTSASNQVQNEIKTFSGNSTTSSTITKVITLNDGEVLYWVGCLGTQQKNDPNATSSVAYTDYTVSVSATKITYYYE